MAKEQDAQLFHVLVLTTEQYALLQETLREATETCSWLRHDYGSSEESNAGAAEGLEAFQDLQRACVNGWDVHEDDKASLHEALDQLSYEA